MNLQPVLSDELVFLRPLRDDDYDMLYEVAKDPGIWQQHPCPDRYQEEVFQKYFAESIASGGALVIIENASAKIIGSTRFEQIESISSAIEIGWTFLGRKYWGGAYNKAIKNLMIDYAFKSVDVVVFYIGKNNFRSQRAVEKLGGQRLKNLENQPFRKDPKKNYTYLIRKIDW